MTDSDWELLLRRIETGRCTPFLGAGVASGALPLGGDIASRWAADHDYPLGDAIDLARVAQYVGVTADDLMLPKELMSAELAGCEPPAFAGTEPHHVLAQLPLPVYITTNYDDFMVRALVEAHKAPQRDFCRWNRSPTILHHGGNGGADFVPTPATPLVFHLHGHAEVHESMVLTEDDYLDFLVAISRDADLLPHQVQRALAGTSLLFIGYSLSDWDFRVIHRGLVAAGEPSLRRLSVTVQLPRDPDAKRYLDKYFGSMRLRAYWGTAAEFAAELAERWQRRTPAVAPGAGPASA